MNRRLIGILAGVLCTGRMLAAVPATNQPGVTKYYFPAAPADAKVMPSGYTAIEAYINERSEALANGTGGGK